MEESQNSTNSEIPREKPDWFREPPSKEVKTIPGKNGGTILQGDYGQGALGGRPKGRKNRSTILNQYMDIEISRTDPITGERKTLPLEEFIELEMIAKVLEERDVQTYKEIKDTRFGKITDNLNVTGDVDLSHAIQLKVEFEKPDPTEPKPDEPQVS